MGELQSAIRRKQPSSAATITGPSIDGLRYVARHMRAWDELEIYATRWRQDPDELAADCWARRDFCWLVVPPGEPPAVAFGAVPRWPNVYSVWMFATPRIVAVRLLLHRYITRVMIPGLRGGGARRADCMSMDGHTDAHAWLLALGARRHQEPFMNWGRGGETFWQFYWE